MNKKLVLVTGSSRGIGRTIAERLAKDGWSVAIHGAQDSEALDQTAKSLGERCLGKYVADLADSQQAASLVHRVISDHGLDALVNNAGIYRTTDFLNDSEEEVEREYQEIHLVNWHSPRRMIYRACQHFRRQGGGKVLNVVSRVAHRGEARASAYSSSKAALLNLTRALAVETAAHNIQHFAIAPGWVETSLSREGMEERLQEILATIPLGRMATPEDCAGAAAYLLSDEASYLSGVVIDINGASYLR